MGFKYHRLIHTNLKENVFCTVYLRFFSEVYSHEILRHNGFLFKVLSEKVKCKIICCCEFLKNTIENMAENEEFKVTY